LRKKSIYKILRGLVQAGKDGGGAGKGKGGKGSIPGGGEP